MAPQSPALGLGEELDPPPGAENDQINTIVAIHLEVADRHARPVRRGQHPKHQGCVQAEFLVEGDLPEACRYGLFREPRRFEALIRFSNGRNWDDSKPDIHGMAVKLLGVEGEKVLETERYAKSHDFVMVDNPVFFVRNVADYVPFMNDFRRLNTPGFSLGKLISLGKVALSPDYKFRMLREAMSKTPDSPLRSQYWSTTPSKLGPGAMKFSARPVLDGTPAPPRTRSKNMLREAMAAHLKTREARFDFLVQLQTDPVSMPVEDPTVPWDAPYQKVATIRIPPQIFDSPEQLAFCENLSFTPWHALPEHRPLGGINRARKAIYAAVSFLRHELNGVPELEPSPETVP